LCVIDMKPRTFSRQDNATLQSLANELIHKMESDVPGAG
jgi:hypothetical protein